MSDHRVVTVNYEIQVLAADSDRWWAAAERFELWSSALKDSAGILSTHVQAPSSAHLYQAVRGDEIYAVGYAFPEHFHTRTEHVRVAVAPDRRGEGAGRNLLESIAQHSSNRGASVLLAAECTQTALPESVSHLLAETTFERQDVSVEQVLSIRAGSEPVPAPPGSQILTWENACPDELVERYAGLVADGFDLEPAESSDLVRQFRAAERQARELGKTMVVSVAISDAGRLLGHTRISFERLNPQQATQGVTLIAPQFRRQGWASRLKEANTRRLRELSPSTTQLVTVNSTTNTPILKLNESLGYKQHAKIHYFKRLL